MKKLRTIKKLEKQNFLKINDRRKNQNMKKIKGEKVKEIRKIKIQKKRKVFKKNPKKQNKIKCLHFGHKYVIIFYVYCI